MSQKFLCEVYTHLCIRAKFFNDLYILSNYILYLDEVLLIKIFHNLPKKLRFSLETGNSRYGIITPNPSQKNSL